MIKAILFDFDGVILESADLKTVAFGKLFEGKFPDDKVKEFVEFHKKNMGISRFVKFRHFYNHIIHTSLPQEEEILLGDRFSALVLEEILKAPFVRGARETLETYYQKYPLFVASGTPSEELNLIVQKRGLSSFFREVRGTPETKPVIIRDLLSKCQLEPNEAVFVGDAESDLKASKETGIHFIARITPESTALLQCENQMHDFTEFGALLKRF